MVTPVAPVEATPTPEHAFGPADMEGLRLVQNSGRTRGVAWRRAQLAAIEQMIADHEDEFVAAIAADLGRDGFDAYLGDLAVTRSEAAYARKRLRWWMRRRPVALPLNQLPGRAWVQYEPKGVVLVIGPWNYPVQLTLAPLIAALSAGNCVVVKPSELAPASSAVMARLIPQYLDPTAIRVVEGDGGVTQALLGLGFDHVLFTGGTEIGRKILAGAAPTLTPATLELGGKSPAYVAADADIEVTARRIVWTKLLNSGQTCIAPDYILADPPIVGELITALQSTIDTFLAGADAGRQIVNARQFDRIRGYLESTTGTIVLGGTSDRQRLTIDPTIVVSPAPDDDLMTQEIFGPVLPILTVDSPEDAIAFVNSRPKPLALYVFTESRALGRRMIDVIPAGGAVINHAIMHCLVPQLPFGGIGASGMGAYHGRWGFEELSHRKAVLAKPSTPDLSLLYPPYSARDIRILRKLL